LGSESETWKRDNTARWSGRASAGIARPGPRPLQTNGPTVPCSWFEPQLFLYLLDKFIKSDPKLKKGESVRFLAGAVPVSEPIKAVKDNIVLVGDAARQVDPITGGGLMASIEAGKAAGERIGEAVIEQNFDEGFLSLYEDKIEKTLYKKLKRNYVVKEILLDMEDKTLNMLADSLKDYNFDELSTLSLLKALVAKHPSLLIRLKPLLRLSRL